MTYRLPLLCVATLALAACQRNATPVTAPAPAPAGQQHGSAPARAPHPRAGVDKPALRVTTIDGKPFDLAGQRGRWVLVNYWATWCGPCLKEMPELSALAAMREHVEVIGLDYEDTTPDALRAFLRNHPVVYPVAIVDLYDPPKDFDPPRGLPTTYLIAPDGRIAKHFLGPVTAKDVDDAIAAAGGPKAG